MTENQVKIYTDPGNGIGTPSHNNYNKVNFTFLYISVKNSRVWRKTCF